MRTRTLLLLATSVTVALVVASSFGTGGATSSSTGQPSAALLQTGPGDAAAVLRAWDHRRGRAWARGDPRALAHLYAAGSRTGRHDVRDLARWHDRGLRVVGVRQQVTDLSVEVDAARVLVLSVTDRTVDAVAVGHGRRTALPASAWVRHRIRLRRVHGAWVVAEATAQPAR